ncbi:MAG: cobalamin biosynthesis protein [Pseudomonadota bacterium]
MCKPSIAMVAITVHGITLLAKFSRHYPQADIYLPEKFSHLMEQFPLDNQPLMIKKPLKQVMGDLFEQYDFLLFVFSIGAAVRLMAPWLKSKREDPGVVVTDDNGQFMIPILSGHIGGANDFASEMAKLINATPVYTTASEARQTIAVDILGRDLDWIVEASHRCQIKVAAQLVNDEEIAFIQDAGNPNWWPKDKKLPNNIHLFTDFKSIDTTKFSGFLWVTHNDIEPSILDLLAERLIIYRPPKIEIQDEKIVLGIGCDRNTPIESIETAVLQALKSVNLNIKQVLSIASIDKKSDEIGLLNFAKQYQHQIIFYTAQELSAVTVPNPSAVVKKHVGTAAVAEAAALLSAQTKMHDLMVEKYKFRGEDNRNVTVSIARYQSVQ